MALKDPRAWGARQRTLAWTNLAALFGLGFLAMVLVIAHAERRPRRIDMTATQIYALNELTHDWVVNKVRRNVYLYITGVDFTQDPSMRTAMGMLENLLEEFHRLNPRFIHVRGINQEVPAEELTQIQRALGTVMKPGTIYVMSYRSTTEGVETDPIVKDVTLAELFQGDPHTGKVVEFYAESILCNLLAEVVNDKPHIVYVTVGHGELLKTLPQGVRGVQTFHMMGQLMERRLNIQFQDLAPSFREVPSDAELVFIARPVLDFAGAEIEALRRYLERGGRIFLCAERATTLNPLMLDFDVRISGDWLMVDLPERSYIPLLLRAHPTTGFQIDEPRSSTAWFQVTEVDEAETRKRPELTVRPVARTAMPVVPVDYERALAALRTEQFRLPGPGSPRTVAVAVNGKLGNASRETRLVVWGSSWGPMNPYSELNQAYLFQNTLQWLLATEGVMQVPVIKRGGLTPLFISADEGDRIFWGTTAGMPAVAALLGVAFWIVRRK
jgi:hypothetical protein